MKTLFIISGMVAMVAISSCAKEETCVCVNSSDEIVRTNTYSASYDEALDLCNASAAELNESDTIGETYFCTLE